MGLLIGCLGACSRKVSTEDPVLDTSQVETLLESQNVQTIQDLFSEIIALPIYKVEKTWFSDAKRLRSSNKTTNCVNCLTEG